MNPPEEDPNAPCRGFLLVINKPQTTDLTPILHLDSRIRYCIWQLESGENDASLIRAYLELSKSERKSAISRLFPIAWIEKRTGTRDEARESCRRPDNRIDGPWEYGEWIDGRGRKPHSKILKQWLREGKTEEEIRELNLRIWKSNIQVIRAHHALLTLNRDDSEELSIPIGDYPSTEIPSRDRNIASSPNLGWWTNYSNRQIAIMNDFIREIPLSELLQLCNQSKQQLQINGGIAKFFSGQIFITSNTNFDHCSNLEPVVAQKTFEKHVSIRHVFEILDGDIIRVITKKYDRHHPQRPIIEESRIFIPLSGLLSQLHVAVKTI